MIPRLHIVTDDATLAAERFSESARLILGLGAERVALHVRGPHTPAGELFGLLERLVARSDPAPIVVNDRVDLALALGIDRVHLGRRSLPPAVARALLGVGARVGLSVHGVTEAERSMGEVDYWMLGNVFETASHPGRPSGGSELVRSVSALSGAPPVIAIGGIRPEHAGRVLDAGAHGVAVLSGVWSAGDPVEAVQRYLEVLQITEDPKASDE